MEVIHDLSTSLLKMGRGLQLDPDGDVELERYGEHLPGRNLIFHLSNSHLFFTVKVLSFFSFNGILSV